MIVLRKEGIMNKLLFLLIPCLLITFFTAGCQNSDTNKITDPPTGVLLTEGNGQITITWTTVAGADSYNIYYDTSPGVTKTSNKISDVTAPYTHTGLINGTVYYYIVTAVNTAGESDPSSEISATPTPVPVPAVPQNVKASGGIRSTVLQWDAVAGATSYNIYWSTEPGVTKSTGTKVSGITSFLCAFAYLTNGITYYYVVTAVASAGESNESAEVSAIPSAVRLPKTGQTTSYASEDDGSFQIGTPWQSNRFVNLDGTAPASDDAMRDTLTGLIWTRDANAPGPPVCTPAAGKKWQGALDHISCLNANNYLGYSDWRLPNRKEIRSLVDYSQNTPALPAGHPFINVMSTDYYWTSTTYAADTSYAWVTYMSDGRITRNFKPDVNFRIWPVRTGDNTVHHLISLPVTGQTTSYAAGDDGSLQTGVVWPSVRFMTDVTGDCINDSLTGLVWLKAPDSISRSWADALTQVSSTNACGYTDWRVPNINELESLIHAELSDTAAWLNTTQGFSGIQAGKYWSATTISVDSTRAWYVTLNEGYIEMDYKASSYYFYVLPVRGGQ